MTQGERAENPSISIGFSALSLCVQTTSSAGGIPRLL